MTKQEARAWRERWEAVNQREIDEVRRTSPDMKLAQVWELMRTGAALGWRPFVESDVEQVRERWDLLRARLHV